MENEEKIRLEARRRLEEQLKQYRVQRHKERVSDWSSLFLLTRLLLDFEILMFPIPASSLYECGISPLYSGLFRCGMYSIQVMLHA